MPYQPTIGLEIHVELKTKSKMFCSCPNETWKLTSAGEHDIKPNTNICPVCMGHPGTLPVPNRQAIEFVLKAGLALNCQLSKISKFDRKQYFYPDLPKGYQISQYDQPFCEHGHVETTYGTVGITRIHLEEDTGKLTHGADGSLVDYNRAGVSLMELVTEPDIKRGAGAKEFCQELQSIFRELNIADANMEKGQMRCEVNISVSDNDQLGTKVEIKNLNSFKAVERSIEYEIKRQTKLLENSEKIIQETRGWDENKGQTFSQRIKEGSADYRYFPEPDIPPIDFSHFSDINIEKIKAEMPELPQAKRQRFAKLYGLKTEDARLISSQPDLADYFENVISELKRWLLDTGNFEGTVDEIWEKNKEKLGKQVANWLINKLGGLLTARKLSWTQTNITPENFAELMTMIFENKVSTKNANLLLEHMLTTGGDPSNILEDEDLGATGSGEIEEIVQTVINSNSDQVEQYQAGKENILKYLIGQVMKESRGKVDPKQAEELLIKLIG